MFKIFLLCPSRYFGWPNCTKYYQNKIKKEVEMVFQTDLIAGIKIDKKKPTGQFDGNLIELPQKLLFKKNAACKSSNPEIFWDETNGGPGNPGGIVHERLAKVAAVCNSCAVKQACFEYSLRHEQYNTWAGLTGKQRKQLREEHDVQLVDPYKEMWHESGYNKLDDKQFSASRNIRPTRTGVPVNGKK